MECMYRNCYKEVLQKLTKTLVKDQVNGDFQCKEPKMKRESQLHGW